ncbi:MAG: molybdopterin molybdotransferase MoeA [Lachnospiraceae bacterium]|nr:molybdopterin molybdotransferase MoeA [Lachnospiraceae bacterium]
MAVRIPEGRQMIIDRVRPVGTERVPLEKAYGRILAEEIKAAEDVPAFDRSPYDGYAFRSADVKEATKDHPVILKVIDNIPAGDIAKIPLKKGEAVRLMTGAPIPEGADAVRKYEETDFTETEVKIFCPANAGENIIYTGEDVKKGTILAQSGMKIDSGLMGTLAGQNIPEPLVFRKLKVGIVITGSELVPVGTIPGPGMIINTNQYTLTGAVEEFGYTPVSYGIIPDDLEEIKKALRQAVKECDVVLATGGAAVGDYDLTPLAMEEIGTEILFRNVKMKPGKACAYGIANGKLICGLSGHPSSSLLNLLVVGLPGIRKISGQKDYSHKEIEMEVMGGYEKSSDTDRAVRGKFFIENGTAKINISAPQGNVVISGTIGTDSIVMIPAGSEPVKEGTILKGFMI